MTVSGLIVKAAGLFYKVPLTRIIGEEGMGYYSSAYTLFTWIYMLTASGLPSAASVLIARYGEKERSAGAVRVLRTALLVFTAAGAFFGAVLYFGADELASVMRMEKAAPAIRVVAPTLVFISAASAFRGYFQGLGNFVPHSVSQVIEALFKVVVGVLAAHIIIDGGGDVSEAAAGAVSGITVGVLFGTLLMCVICFAVRKAPTREIKAERGIAGQLIKCAFPIALSSGVMSLAGIMDSFIMSKSLHGMGYSQAECAAVWGNYSSLAVPFFNLPPVLTLPIAYALLPALSGAVASGNHEKSAELTREAVSRTAFLAVPCAVGMCAFSEPILELLFDDAVASRGALMLTLLAPSSMLLCMLSLFNTLLQASGHERLPLVSMLTGAVMKLAATYLLTPRIGKYATPVSTFVCYFTAALISVVFIVRRTKLSRGIGIGALLFPTVLSLVSVSAAALILPFAGTVISAAVAALMYFSLYALATRGKNRSLNERKYKNEGTYRGT